MNPHTTNGGNPSYKILVVSMVSRFATSSIGLVCCFGIGFGFGLVLVLVLVLVWYDYGQSILILIIVLVWSYTGYLS